MEYYHTFIAVAKANSFSKAAEQLNIVQSTASSRINELESYLEQKLFVRNNRTVEITHAGKVFLPYAEKMLRTEREGIRKMSTLKLFEDNLKISVNGNVYREKLRPVVEEFSEKYPQYSLTVDFHGTYAQLNMLFDNEVDIGFIGRKPNTQRLTVVPYCDYSVILVASKNYTVNTVIDPEDLLSIDFFYANQSDEFNHWLSDFLTPNYKSPLHINDLLHLINLVKDNMGCAFLPSSMVQGELASGEFKMIKIKGTKPLVFKNYIAINKKRKDSNAVQAFLSLIPEI